MGRRRCLLAGPCAATTIVMLASCQGWRFQRGLSNVPAANRPWGDDDFAHDVISNGDESCPPGGHAEDGDCFFSSRSWPWDVNAKARRSESTAQPQP